MGDIACSPGEFLLLSPHKIYLFFLILFSTSTCEGRLSKQLHGALLPAAVKSLQAPDSFCEAAWLKLCCCCLSRVGGPEQPLLSLVLLGKWREGWERGYCLAVEGQR